MASVGDADPADPDPHLLGPPGSGSISQADPDPASDPSLSHKCVERTEIMLAKIKF